MMEREHVQSYRKKKKKKKKVCFDSCFSGCDSACCWGVWREAQDFWAAAGVGPRSNQRLAMMACRPPMMRLRGARLTAPRPLTPHRHISWGRAALLPVDERRRGSRGAGSPCAPSWGASLPTNPLTPRPYHRRGARPRDERVRRLLHGQAPLCDAAEKESAAGGDQKELTAGGARPAKESRLQVLQARARALPGVAWQWSCERAVEVRHDPKLLLVWSKAGYQLVRHFIHHTWVGAKLLATETRIASRILVRVLRGSDISRRERMLLQRVVMDLFRMVPFSFFILVPAMELFLPLALKLFPNMIPSQFTDGDAKEAE
eukprot:COSAG01_NODE_11846_length_1848_cov_29.579519_1_plen_316_part_10